MPNFLFRVGSADGEISERELVASDVETASEQIRRQGLHIFGVRRTGFALPRLRGWSNKVISTERFLLFNQELLALVRAGLPILQSFDIMLERQKQPRFRQVLIEIREKLSSGVALSDAFASFGSAFPPIYSTSIRAGERSGDLEGVLKRFLRYQKLIVALRKRVIGALVYPAVLTVLSLAMVFVMLTVVIPKFSEFYEGFDAELPAITQFMIGLASFLRRHALLVLASIAALVVAIRRWSNTGAGGRTFDRFKLRLPVIGTILQEFAIMQFTQSLGTLLAGGTPMVPSIEIAAESITNKEIAFRVRAIVQLVREGEPLWRSLDSTKVIGDLAVEMIKVGESTGALVEMLNNVSEFYDEDLETRLTRMVALIEPAILVFLGLVIAVLLYAFYLPLFELTNVTQQ
ncbi:MAG TPA: type II secretion system F family protein [Thermoanaerobaculia bacterium]|nr:type II secretion system F family protein [Thermoanaerobaculia bacterium]